MTEVKHSKCDWHERKHSSSRGDESVSWLQSDAIKEFPEKGFTALLEVLYRNCVSVFRASASMCFWHGDKHGQEDEHFSKNKVTKKTFCSVLTMH